MKSLKTYYILFLFIAIITSCEKEETIPEKQLDENYFLQLENTVENQFFDYNYISAFNPILEQIALNKMTSESYGTNTLKSTEDLYSPFIEEVRQYFQENDNKKKQLEKHYGYPMWDRLVEMNLENRELAVIPIANTSSNKIEAILYAYKKNNGSIKLHLAVRGKFKEYPLETAKIDGKRYPDREFVISQFIYFDKEIFDYVDCDLLEEYKNVLGINDENLKSASTVECTVTITQTTTDDYYAVFIGGDLVKFAYSYSEVEYDVNYYCSNTDVHIPMGGGSNPSGSNPGDLDDFESIGDNPTPTIRDNPTPSSLFFQDIDRINMNDPELLQKISCLIRELALSGGRVLTPQVFEGVGDYYSHGYEYTKIDFNYLGSIVTITVIYDAINETAGIQNLTDTHSGEVIAHEIRVYGTVVPDGSKPNLIRLRFQPEDVGLYESVWKHIKGETNLWNCN